MWLYKFCLSFFILFSYIYASNNPSNNHNASKNVTSFKSVFLTKLYDRVNLSFLEGLCVECIKLVCNEILQLTVEPSYESGGIWKHNVRCDLFNNYYDIQYPWEIEFIESLGQTVNTVRSVEYQLESYLYQPLYGEDGCVLNYGCGDRWMI